MIRLVTGSWCILAFVLVTAYQSLLISYLLAPVSLPPIINGMKDLAQRTDVGLVVDNGLGIDALFSVV